MAAKKKKKLAKKRPTVGEGLAPSRASKKKKLAKKKANKRPPAEEGLAPARASKQTTTRPTANTLLYVPTQQEQALDERPWTPRTEGWTCAGRWPSRSSETRDRLTPPLELSWRTSIGRSCRAAPVVSLDGVVYVPDTKGGLFALDGVSGRQVEVLRTDPILEGSPLYSLVEDGRLPSDQVPISSAPAIAGWNLLFGDDEGIFYCVRRGDATVMWRKSIPQLSVGARANCAYQAPTVHQGAVYTVDHDGNLYAADVRSGRSVFSPRQLRGRPVAPPAISGRWVLVATTPLFRGEAAGLHALDAASGARSWRDDLPAAPTAVALGRELALVAGAFGVRALDLRSGSLRWSVSSDDLGGSPVGPLALDRRRVYVGLPDRVVALDLFGQQRWDRVTKVDAGLSGVSVGGGVVWATAGRSLLGWGAEEGDVLSRTRLPGVAVGGPALALGRLYVATGAGEIGCFEGT